MGFHDLFLRKEKPRPIISTPPSFYYPRVSEGQNGGFSTYSENARPSLQSQNQRSERYPHSQPYLQPHSQPRSQPRTTIPTAPPFSNNPWVSMGQNGEISNVSEYAHPDLPQPLNQPSERYHQSQPQRHSQSHPQSHPQSQYQPRLYPHPAQRPEQNVVRTPVSIKAENYFPPQNPNPRPSYSVAGSFAHQPAVLATGINHRGLDSSPAPQHSTQLSMEPPPRLGYVPNPYGNPQQASSHSGASARGQYQGFKSNQPPSALPPRPSGQGQYQELKSNQPPSPVSPMDTQYPEFPSLNQYSR